LTTDLIRDIFITETEGKGCTMNTLAEDQPMQERFSEVFDWRPSVEKTDVMRTMEAIESIYLNLRDISKAQALACCQEKIRNL